MLRRILFALGLIVPVLMVASVWPKRHLAARRVATDGLLMQTMRVTVVHDPVEPTPAVMANIAVNTAAARPDGDSGDGGCFINSQFGVVRLARSGSVVFPVGEWLHVYYCDELGHQSLTVTPVVIR